MQLPRRPARRPRPLTLGLVARGRFTHYDLLRTIEHTLGDAPLGAARTRSDSLARQLGLTP